MVSVVLVCYCASSARALRGIFRDLASLETLARILEESLHPGRELEIPQREALVAPRLCFCCVAVGDGLGAPHAHAVSTRLGRKHGPYAGVLERGPHETLRMDVKKVRVFLKRSSAIELRLGASSVGVDIFSCGARPPARRLD